MPLDGPSKPAYVICSQPIHLLNGLNLGSDSVLSGIDQTSQWFLQTDETQLRTAGVKLRGGGPHQSKTMMLADLAALVAANGERDPSVSILHRNVLGKPSLRAREAALYRLRQLYGLDDSAPICRALLALWARDPAGRPMLALLCALARDPSLRELEVPSVRDLIADRGHDARGLASFEDDRDCIGLGPFEIRVDKFVTTALWRLEDRNVALRGPLLHPALKLVGDVA
jgi:hypothetical protein